MQKILNLANSLIMDDNTQKILKGQLQQGLIMSQISYFNHLDVYNQNLYTLKLHQRLNQLTKPHKLLTVMFFFDTIIHTNPNFNLPEITSKNIIIKQEKQSLCLCNIARYYNYYLKACSISRITPGTNPEEELAEVYKYCQMAILRMKQFFKIDFLFTFGSKLKKRYQLLREIVCSILSKFRSDLYIMNELIKNNLNLILEDNVQLSLIFQTNHIYEKLIFINKQIKKLEKVAKAYNLCHQFPKYKIDVEFNRKIEMKMLTIKRQKQEYYANRNRKEAEDKQSDCYLEDIDVEIRTSQSFQLIRQEEY